MQPCERAAETAPARSRCSAARPSGRALKPLSWLLVAVWALGMAVAFWSFIYRDVGAFSEVDIAFFDTRAIEELISSGVADSTARGRVVHFWNPDCRCTRFNRGHAKEVMQSYSARGIEFLVAVPAADMRSQAHHAFPQASEVIVASRLSDFSSPAAAAFDGYGELVYFGPYSEGAFCTTGDDAPVERVLDALVAAEAPRAWLNLSAVGCYCPWPAA
jgi:hypothetical protein